MADVAPKRLARSWPELERTVREAIDDTDDAARLPALFVVERLSPREFRRDRPAGVETVAMPGPGTHRVERFGVDRSWLELVHILRLGVGELGDPPMDDIATWAGSARLLARQEVLRSVAWASMTTDAVDNSPESVWPAVGAANDFHHSRLVRFAGCVELRRSPEQRLAVSDLRPGRFVEQVDLERPPGIELVEVLGLLYELCGGPVLFRCEDLTLTGRDVDGGDVELVLTERLRVACGPAGAVRRITGEAWAPLDVSAGSGA